MNQSLTFLKQMYSIAEGSYFLLNKMVLLELQLAEKKRMDYRIESAMV